MEIGANLSKILNFDQNSSQYSINFVVPKWKRIGLTEICREMRNLSQILNKSDNSKIVCTLKTGAPCTNIRIKTHVVTLCRIVRMSTHQSNERFSKKPQRILPAEKWIVQIAFQRRVMACIFGGLKITWYLRRG